MIHLTGVKNPVIELTNPVIEVKITIIELTNPIIEVKNHVIIGLNNVK